MAKTDKTKQDDYYFTDCDYLDDSDACSMHECTGLIPKGFVKENAINAYNDIYEFGKTEADKTKKSGKNHTDTVEQHHFR